MENNEHLSKKILSIISQYEKKIISKNDAINSVRDNMQELNTRDYPIVFKLKELEKIIGINELEYIRIIVDKMIEHPYGISFYIDFEFLTDFEKNEIYFKYQDKLIDRLAEHFEIKDVWYKQSTNFYEIKILFGSDIWNAIIDNNIKIKFSDNEVITKGNLSEINKDYKFGKNFDT